jgi:alkanesulfonate monooxygenase SsuD/methylene tetrahydromethanopterin reductase-like flavin-dependent oxidoreductase (luciferase family)
MRDLLTTGTAEYQERRLNMSWKSQTPVPLWIAADGPKTLELAAEVADGVIILADRFAAVGPPEVCARKLATVAEAGIRNFLFTGFVADRSALMQALGGSVLPQVWNAVAAV